MAYTTPTNIKALWLSSTPPPNDSIIEAWINGAELLIFSEYPHLKDHITADPAGDWLGRVISVASQMVVGVLQNPEGVRQLSNTAGTFTKSVTYGTETIAQSLSLTPQMRLILQGGRKKAYGVDMTPAPPPHDLITGARINGPLGTGPGGR